MILHMTRHAGPQDYVGNLKSPWKTSNILGTVLTVTPPQCKSDGITRIVLDPDERPRVCNKLEIQNDNKWLL